MPRTRESSSTKPRTPRASHNGPTHDEIALRAYLIFLERNGAPGDELEDWVRAERELLGKNKKPRRKATVRSIAA